MAQQKYVIDPHSFFQPGDPVVERMALLVSVSPQKRELRASAFITFSGEGLVRLDTKGLTIMRVYDNGGQNIAFEIGENDSVRGQSLSFTVPACRLVKIDYHTSSDPDVCSGLQWCGSGDSMFLFSQGQAINARSIMPCQDTPSVRFTMHCLVTTPAGLSAVVGGVLSHRLYQSPDATDQFVVWKIDNRIPAYLFSLAVGRLHSADISNSHRVWADSPEMATRAAAEFRDVGKFMAAAEKLFGPYRWGRFDMLIAPASFPYGGMENPYCTFLSSTVVAGDGSGVNVLAHELAHAWTGNLVGNARWCDFWLNEGWTVYAELRILEEVYGVERARLQLDALERDYHRSVQRFQSRPELLKLCPDISDTEGPDDVFSTVPYYKGARMLIELERLVGRHGFDFFIRRYIAEFAGQGITTEQFIEFAQRELPKATRRLNMRRWIYEPGIPENVPIPVSQGAEEARRYARAMRNRFPSSDVVSTWPALQLAIFLEALPQEQSGLWAMQLAEFGVTHGLHVHGNAEIRCAFLLAMLKADMLDNRPLSIRDSIAEFLSTVGRMKFINPIYRALNKSPAGREFAEQLFEQNKGFYHPVAVNSVSRILQPQEQPAEAVV